MRLLFIGEEQDALQRATTFLRDGGYSVDVAENCDYGKFRWLEGEYNLVLLDLTSPTSQELADDPELQKQSSDTPVLMLKTRDSDSNSVDTHSSRILLKPFTRSELLGRVRTMVLQPSAMGPSSIEIGSVVIDRNLRTVTVNRNDVSLTYKEYCLLELLAVHRGTIVSRNEIYNHLFDIMDSSLSNLVDVYMCKIRRKLGEKLISTRRGAGYVIES